MRIKSSEDRPYFYGLGMPTKYCCHDGFEDVPEPLELKMENTATADEYEPAVPLE